MIKLTFSLQVDLFCPLFVLTQNCQGRRLMMGKFKFLSFRDLNLNCPPFLGISQPHVHGPLQHFRVLIMTTTTMIFMVLDSRLGITITSQMVQMVPSTVGLVLGVLMMAIHDPLLRSQSSAFGILPQDQCLSLAQPLLSEIFMKE